MVPSPKMSILCFCWLVTIVTVTDVFISDGWAPRFVFFMAFLLGHVAGFAGGEPAWRGVREAVPLQMILWNMEVS